MSTPKTSNPIKRAGKKAEDFLKKAVWSSCKYVFWICCGPCFLYALCLRPRRHRGPCVHIGENLDPPRPVALPPRARSLTLPLIRAEKNQVTSDQLQSAFMMKLPLEIRRLIYSELLGGAAAHLETLEGRPRASRCNRSACRCAVFCPYMERKLEFSLTMLRTCRRIYSEAIEYLYSDNQFSLTTIFDQYPSVDYLSYYFLPQRLTRIRSLNIHWELENRHYTKMPGFIHPDVSAWNRSWSALHQLSGLQRLHIVIAAHTRPWSEFHLQQWKAVSSEILANVQLITAPVDFVITLPDRGCCTALEVGESKCVFKLPDGTERGANAYLVGV